MPLPNTPVLNGTVQRYGGAMSTWDPVRREAWIEEAAVDAYGKDEQLTGIFTTIETTIEESLAVRFTTTVLGVDVSVAGVDPAEDGRAVAGWLWPRVGPTGHRNSGPAAAGTRVLHLPPAQLSPPRTDSRPEYH